MSGLRFRFPRLIRCFMATALILRSLSPPLSTGGRSITLMVANPGSSPELGSRRTLPGSRTVPGSVTSFLLRESPGWRKSTSGDSRRFHMPTTYVAFDTRSGRIISVHYGAPSSHRARKSALARGKVGEEHIEMLLVQPDEVQ